MVRIHDAAGGFMILKFEQNENRILKDLVFFFIFLSSKIREAQAGTYLTYG